MSKLDSSCIWSPSQLLTWEQSLREEYRDWESDKSRWEARYNKKVKLVSARETDALAWEKELTEREGHLAGCEEAIRSREMDLASKEEELLSDAYKFCRDLHCDHQVGLVFVYISCVVLLLWLL